MQNEGTGKSSWWMLNPEALPISSHTRRSSGGACTINGNGGATSTGGSLCNSTAPSLLNNVNNGVKQSNRRRANTLDSTIPRTIDKRARAANVKTGNRRRGDSGNNVCRLSSNG